MSREILTTDNAMQIYNECMDYPELIDDLDSYTTKKLLVIAKKEWRIYNHRIGGLIMSNPPEEYQYPAEYLPNQLGKYWAKSINDGEPWEHYKMIDRLEKRLSSKKGERETPIPILIKEFADEFEKNKNARYSSETIQLFLKEWEGVKELSSPRARAKKRSGISGVADGTLANWENHWITFRESRTGK